jgi:quercetin dioxygenase-like cupin family protein
MARDTTYERFMRDEGIPIVRGYGVTDVRGLELAPWKRVGGRGAYIQLEGMEGLTGMYVGEIPPGGALEPEKHLYDKLVYVLDGRGVTQVWSREDQGRKSMFEWQAGALFAPPANAWHRLLNASGSEPARFLAVTTAPLVLDLFHNVDFVLHSDYVFDDRYDGRPDYYNVGERRMQETSWGAVGVWETNFIPDVRMATLDPSAEFGADNAATCYEMAGNVLVGHMAQWPVGKYRKAHHHGGGAILLIVRSEGYTVMWPQSAGIRPHESGHGDDVVKVDWREGSVFSPPSGWFHQHFNTGAVPARQLALRYGSQHYGVQFHDTQSAEGAGLSVRLGGTVIEYEDEDPELRRRYLAAIAANGVEYQMPAIAAAAS